MNVNGVNFVQTGDPNADLMTYAAARGISEAEAKTEPQTVFGDPQVPGVNATSADEESVIVGDTETATGLDDSTKASVQSSIDGLRAAYQQLVYCYSNNVSFEETSAVEDQMKVYCENLLATLDDVDESLLTTEMKNQINMLKETLITENATFNVASGNYNDTNVQNFHTARDVRKTAGLTLADTILSSNFLS